MQIEKQLNVITESGENEFQVRFLKKDGVGLITTKKEENYLILDSLDYWYDLIQNQYPKKKKCSCKNEWFKIQFKYISKPDSADFNKIEVFTICTNCDKKTKSLSIDIDYSPTNELFSKPISYCNKPNIKYKFNELSSYWSGNNLKDFLNYMINELNLNVYCWFSEFPAYIRKFEKITFDKALKIISINHKYLNFFFCQTNLNTKELIKFNDRNGVFIDSDCWRKNEIISLSSPFIISGYLLLYYIRFCNQYIDKGKVIDKTKSFDDITTKLINWLKAKFITKRSKNSFDGEAAYNEIITKQNSKK